MRRKCSSILHVETRRLVPHRVGDGGGVGVHGRGFVRRQHGQGVQNPTFQEKLLRKDFFEGFCREFAKEMNRFRMEQRASLTGAKRELERVQRDIRKVIEAIKAGFPLPELKPEMESLQARKEALLAQLATSDDPPPLLHPSMADLYRSKVEEPASALQREDTRLEASESLRGLVDSIVLTPRDGQLGIELRGNLAAMLTAAQKTKRSPETGDLQVPMKLVAGACNQRYLQLWSGAA